MKALPLEARVAQEDEPAPAPPENETFTGESLNGTDVSIPASLVRNLTIEQVTTSLVVPRDAAIGDEPRKLPVNSPVTFANGTKTTLQDFVDNLTLEEVNDRLVPRDAAIGEEPRKLPGDSPVTFANGTRTTLEIFVENLTLEEVNAVLPK